MHEEFFQLLRKDHESIKSILRQLRQLTADESEKRQGLFAMFKLEIKPHTRTEELIFYPPLKEHKEAYEDVLESVEEHHAIELLLNELDTLSIQTDQWRAKLRVCKEIVEHHLEEEEEKIFNHARESLGEEQMHTIYQGFQKMKESLRGSMR